jgi:hypothetical protein
MSYGYFYDLGCDIGNPMLEIKSGTLSSKACYTQTKCKDDECEIISTRCPNYCTKSATKKDNKYTYDYIKWIHENDILNKK